MMISAVPIFDVSWVTYARICQASSRTLPRPGRIEAIGSLGGGAADRPPKRTAGSLSVELQTVTQADQPIAQLAVRGEVDLATAPVVREALVAVLERETGAVVIDLSEVAFLDSTGVHLLVDTHRRLTHQNRRLAIACRDGGQTHRLLALVGLLDTLTVHRSRESALSGGAELIRSEGRNNCWTPAAGTLRQSPAVYQPSKR